MVISTGMGPMEGVIRQAAAIYLKNMTYKRYRSADRLSEQYKGQPIMFTPEVRTSFRGSILQAITEAPNVIR